MGEVQVNGLRFQAFHGCHPDERKIGGIFEVDILVNVDLRSAAVSDNLNDAIDYVALMEIASKEMKKRRDLIETVAQDIADKIKQKYSRAKSVEVTIKKPSAPVIFELDFVAVKAFA